MAYRNRLLYWEGEEKKGLTEKTRGEEGQVAAYAPLVQHLEEGEPAGGVHVVG